MCLKYNEDTKKWAKAHIFTFKTPSQVGAYKSYEPRLL